MSVDQKKIAKNTALLYVRMLFIMLISLYTSREILSALGKVDFGLYNVVGGIVVTFSFLNGIMSAACQRYFAIEIGKSDYDALSSVFRLNVTIFLGLGVIILFLSETVGLWFLNAKMVFPEERSMAVQCVYQSSILAFMINMVSIPYRSIIIAKEKMKVFAYSSVIEAILKLAIVYFLITTTMDKLILYSVLMLVITLGLSLFYWIYCRNYYAECRYKFYWNKPLFIEIIGYTGWNLVGNLAFIGKNQGINILLNLFFGPVFNAARGVAYQVYVNINQFVTSFAMAFNPQITKSYAVDEYKSMLKLVCQSSKFSYFLLYILILPVVLELPFLLDIWLKDVPEYSVVFTELILINALIDSLGTPLATTMQATGKIKWYQIWVGGSMLLILPVSYLMLKFGSYPPEAVFIVSIIFSAVSQIIRIVFVNRVLKLALKDYFRDVLLPVVIVSVLSPIIPYPIHFFIDNNWIELLVVGATAVITTSVVVYFLGLNKSERDSINLVLVKKFGHKHE